MPEVTVGGATFALATPTDTAAAWDCVVLAQSNRSRAMSMALALCWPDAQPHRPRVRYTECSYDAGLFGGRVFAGLTSRGAGVDEVVAAGRVALDLVVAAVPTAKVVQSAVDFTPAQGGA